MLGFWRNLISAERAALSNPPSYTTFHHNSPAYLAKSFFPRVLLDEVGLISVGSRTRRIQPRRIIPLNAPAEVDTTELFVAGKRSSFLRFPGIAASFPEDVPLKPTDPADQFRRIEEFSPMLSVDRVKIVEDDTSYVFEVGLHIPQERTSRYIRDSFAQYAGTCGFQINGEFEFEAGRLLFLAVEGNQHGLESLGQFTLMRIIRPMPKLRGIQTMIRGVPLTVKFELPDAGPVSREPKVAVLDGGLPKDHVIGDFVRRYFTSDSMAQDVNEYVEHGLGVSSAILFGPIEPGADANRPYSPIDHYRVLDTLSDKEDPYELYRTLAHVEEVLLSRQYQFINLSLGPALAVEDHDVHAWTAIIDSILSDGETLMSIAVGNNGEGDEATALNRIQVPADSVNALSVGATDKTTTDWNRAIYSAKGPGRSPGRRKPDIVAFGGSPKEYFHVVAPGTKPHLVATLGTSFAAPYALRSAVGIRAILGDVVHPLTIKALLIHGSELNEKHDIFDVGWGQIPKDLNQLIACEDGVMMEVSV